MKSADKQRCQLSRGDADGSIVRRRVVGRYYDPATDQFLSVDPLLAQTGQPYAFTGDDPLNMTDPLGNTFYGSGPSAVGSIYILVNEEGVPFYVGKTTRAVRTRVAEHTRGSRSRPAAREDTIDLGEFNKSDLPTVEQFAEDYLGLKTGHPGNAINAVSRDKIDFHAVQAAGRELIAEQADPLTGENTSLNGLVQAKAMQIEAYSAGNALGAWVRTRQPAGSDA